MCTFRASSPSPPPDSTFKTRCAKMQNNHRSTYIFFFCLFLSLIFFFGGNSGVGWGLGSRTAVLHLCADLRDKHSECFRSERRLETMHSGLCFPSCAGRNRPLFVSGVSYDACRDLFFFQEDFPLQQTPITATCRCCAHYLHTLCCHVFLCHSGKTALIYEI